MEETYKKIADFSEKHSTITLIAGFSLMGMAAWKLRGDDNSEENKN